MSNKIQNQSKVITGPNTVFSYLNCWEPRRKCDKKKKKRPRDRWENNQKMNKYFRGFWDQLSSSTLRGQRI